MSLIEKAFFQFLKDCKRMTYLSYVPIYIWNYNLPEEEDIPFLFLDNSNVKDLWFRSLMKIISFENRMGENQEFIGCFKSIIRLESDNYQLSELLRSLFDEKFGDTEVSIKDTYPNLNPLCLLNLSDEQLRYISKSITRRYLSLDNRDKLKYISLLSNS